MIEFGHSRRGARHYDHTMPSIATSLSSIATSLEALSKKAEDAVKQTVKSGKDVCSVSRDGKHKPHTVRHPGGEWEDLVVDISCLHCGASGSVTIDTEDVLW